MGKVHFVGIGGIGMSALARLYKAKGYKVSGSDKEKSSITEELENEGISVFLGHCEKNLSGSEKFVFFTEAIPEKNPELQKAKRLGVKTLSYFQGLGEISKNYKTLAVSGAHGKSTTTTLIGILLQELGLSPTVIVGTKVPNFGNKNYLNGGGGYFVVEACEYRESFLNLELFGAIILNVEAEHLDYYKNEENYLNSFKRFAKKIPEEGFLIIGEDKNCEKILEEKLEVESILQVTDKKLNELESLKVPGNHIKLDAIFAIKAVQEITGKKTKKDFLTYYKILEEKFVGSWRRFEILGEKNGNLIISDYAHHPTEIKATLKGAREKYGDEIICIFEPHQYSRTIELFEDFCESFENCEAVVIPSIYKVRDSEEDTKKMSPQKLVDGINKKNGNAIFLDGYEKTKDYLEKLGGEVIIFMGAGDIDKLAREFCPQKFDK